MSARSVADFSVGDRYVNNMARVVTITKVDAQAETIDYVYDADSFSRQRLHGSRPAHQTVGWRKL